MNDWRSMHTKAWEMSHENCSLDVCQKEELGTLIIYNHYSNTNSFLTTQLLHSHCVPMITPQIKWLQCMTDRTLLCTYQSMSTSIESLFVKGVSYPKFCLKKKQIHITGPNNHWGSFKVALCNSAVGIKLQTLKYFLHTTNWIFYTLRKLLFNSHI